MKVLLHNKELWQKFKEHQTEMMVTNSGRYVLYIQYFIYMHAAQLKVTVYSCHTPLV